jgi:glucosamine--fructose-6-phosphate aminotransferase (isomerizing)
MCGIAGYTGSKDAVSVVVEALKRLEYRGYDSAGVAILGESLSVFKDKGRIAQLERVLPETHGTAAIGHTRWATHGKPSKENAHPFLDCKGEIALAHNGIIENFLELREQLTAEGHRFASETDSETMVHLIEKYYRGSLEEATMEAVKHVRGTYAFVIMHNGEPGKIVAARSFSPMVIGLGSGENLLASDVPALLKHTDKVIFLRDQEMAVVTPDSVRILDFDGKEVQHEPQTITWSIDDAERGGFEHFMLKEIFEQPEALHETLLGRFGEIDLDRLLSWSVASIKIVACGTSYHAALAGKYILEELARIPVTAELASEYRYSRGGTDMPLVMLISQSGETADTLAAAREAKKRGCLTLAITNYVGSSMTREADFTFYTRAGLEIGVAATKTFLTQLVAMYLVGIKLGLSRNSLTPTQADGLLDELRSLPRVVQSVLDQGDLIRDLAAKHAKADNMFYIGRYVNYPIALEGALKLKEISYVHAEGYPGGELKHGPLAVISEKTPVIAIAVKDHTYEKMLSNIGEVNARGSPVIGIGMDDDPDLEKYVDDLVLVPVVRPLLSPVPIAVVLQLFAYHVARARGCAIDKPRHLAKTVTVE